MFKKIRDIIDVRIIPTIISWIIFVQTTLPLLEISKYNHSNADDFWMSSQAHLVWADTHSLWETIAQGFKSAVYLWKTWDGCFLSMFIGGLPPGVFHEDYYKYTFVVLAGSLIIALCAFLFVLLVRVFRFDMWHYLMICPIMLTLFLNMSPSAKDAYYWWVGGINYTLFFAVFLMAQAFVLEYMVSRRICFLIIGSVLSFCVGLGNLLSGLVNPVVLVLELLFFLYVNKKDKKRFLFLIPTTCGIAGLLGNVLAPGNLIRGGDSLFSSSVFSAIWGTITASTNFIPHFYRTGMICMFLFITAVIIDGFKKSKLTFSFRYPLAFVVLSYLVYCSVFTPVIYANSAFYGRCKNVSFGVLMIWYLVNIIYLTGWAYNRIKTQKFEKMKTWSVFITMALVIFACVEFKSSFDYLSAKQSLTIGQAQDFDQKVDERFRIYYDDNITEVEIEEITWIPPIFYWDEDSTEGLEYYFQKEYIRLIPEEK